MKLFFRALAKALAGFVCLGLLLFLPAGTLRFWNAWLLTGVLFVPMLALGAAMALKAPELLEKRLRTKEENGEQKAVVALSAVMFLAVFVLAGLDFRFGWSRFPAWLSVAAAAVFLTGYGLYAEVMRENAYLSRVVEVQEGQRVIDTGLYGLVRHPMYFATLLLFMSMPLVLGSVWAFLLMLAGYPLLITRRILDEERTLTAGLCGYAAYKEKVKYRLLPYIW